MRHLCLYLDTSVLGGLADSEPPGQRASTERFFELARQYQAELYSSVIMLQEVAQAPRHVQALLSKALAALRSPILQESDESLAVAEALLMHRALPNRYFDDARHLGVAIAGKMDAVVSWNFRHMVNLERRRKVQAICLLMGYPPIEIVSPWEVFNES